MALTRIEVNIGTGKKTVIELTADEIAQLPVPVPFVPQPDWAGLNAVCLGGALNPLYNRLTGACFVNPSTATTAQLGEANNIAVAKGLMDQAVAVTQTEGAVAASINLLLTTSSYRFTNAEKTLWNTNVTSLGFSSTIHIG